MMRRIGLALIFAAALASPAVAHGPIKGIGAFYNGLLHPVLVPAHLLVLVAIGLLIGQHAPHASRLALPAVAVTLALMLGLGFTAPQTALQWVLLAVALAAGLATALSWTGGNVPPVLLAGAAGIAVALDSTPDVFPAEQTWIALCGTGLGAALIVTYCGGLAAWFDRPWQRIAIRAAGSWIAASAILVLTLDVLSSASASG